MASFASLEIERRVREFFGYSFQYIPRLANVITILDVEIDRHIEPANHLTTRLVGNINQVLQLPDRFVQHAVFIRIE